MSQQCLSPATRLPKTPLQHRAELHRAEQRVPQVLTQGEYFGGSENLQACFSRHDRNVA